jgi:hypothetical protein
MLRSAPRSELENAEEVPAKRSCRRFSAGVSIARAAALVNGVALPAD